MAAVGACARAVATPAAFATSSSSLSSSKAIAAFPLAYLQNGSRTVMRAGTRKVTRSTSGRKLNWIPAYKADNDLKNPSWLDGSLAGDYGFDPLGLGKDPAALKWYREAEIIHGRWALVATLGCLIGQAFSGIPWYEAGAAPEAVAPFTFGSLLGTQILLMSWVEGKRWVDFYNPSSQSVEWATPWSKTAENFANYTGQQGYPGGKFFDPLGLAGKVTGGAYQTDFAKLERLQLAEIKHARLAMVAMLIFYLEAGQGLSPLSPFGL